ncbi:3-deoxy-8-phosphooctulonate synthase [bacterium]|nr:3-deoxy-8-phosphooctulonate synthase [bacterium]
MYRVQIDDLVIGDGAPVVLIAGPCVIESEDHCLRLAERLKEITFRLGLSFIFKASFDKANRSSFDSYRGPGLDKGLDILSKVRERLCVHVLSDIHASSQAQRASKVLDIIQIPAFLCRQTDIISAAAKTGKAVNIKKGQFVSPDQVEYIGAKARKAGNDRILITERGYTFGYNNLVVDFRAFPIIRGLGYPVVFDATHSVQLPGDRGSCSGGEREFCPYLIRAAVAVGCDALFLEVHDQPGNALCDGPNMIPLDDLEGILVQAMEIDRLVKKGEWA